MKLSILCVLMLSLSSAFGATVQMDDGRILNGSVVRQNPVTLWLRVDGDIYQISRDNVSWFSSTDADKQVLLEEPNEEICLNCPSGASYPYNTSHHEELNARIAIRDDEPRRVVLTEPIREARPAVRETREVNLEKVEPAPINTSTPIAPPAEANRVTPVAPVDETGHTISPVAPGSSLATPPFEYAQPRTEAEANSLRLAIPQLSEFAESGDRSAAEETLRAAGPVGLSALYQYGLYNAIPSVRTRAAQLLGEQGGQKAIKPLIEAFYSAASPTIAPYQVQYVETLANQLARLTGQDYYFYARRTARAPEIAAGMLDWWNSNWQNVPPQLGEPKLDPTRRDYAELLRKVRTLNLIHRDFPGANLPPEVAAPPIPNSPSEQEFLSTIPRLPRETINSYGPRAATSGEIPVIKAPDETRDMPGQFRREQMAERLRSLENR